MHELQIAGRILELVEQEMVRQKLSKLTSVDVRIGALSGINPGALTFSYEAACAGTVLEGSSLNVDWIEATGECRDCNRTFEVVDLMFVCPDCGSNKIEMIGGQEIEIESFSAE
ncbi:MAG: hydrogenase maturation nickel metallochaperone HypA [Candidatus Zixiibacteriota bacterium]